MVVSDPDIEHLPFFANTPEFLKSIYSSYYGRILPFDRFTRALIPFQHYLFYVILSLARFNLYRLSYAHLISTIVSPKKRNSFPWHWWLEMVGLCVFYYWYTAVLRGIPDWSTRIAYILITNIVPSPLHVQVSNLSHPSFSRPSHQPCFSSCFPITLDQLPILGLRSHSLRGSCVPRSMWCVPHPSPSFTEGFTSKSHTTSSHVYLVTTSWMLV